MPRKDVFHQIQIGANGDSVKRVAGTPDMISMQNGESCWHYQHGKVIVFFDRTSAYVKKIVKKANEK